MIEAPAPVADEPAALARPAPWHAALTSRPRALLAAVSSLATLATLRRGHHGDTAVFRDWARETLASGALYRTAHNDVNYPALGALLAIAPGRLYSALFGGELTPAQYHAAIKLLLAPCNAALALAGLSALRALRAPRPERDAWLLYALPSTWVLAGYFGQLDGVLFALQLASVALGARALEHAARDEAPRASLALSSLASLAAHAALLTKQLALFALPALWALASLPALLWHLRSRPRAAVAHALVALATPLSLFALDPLIALPDRRRSHLLFVFTGTGPAHDTMLGNGPSIWCFLGAPADDPADVPFAPGLTPRRAGLALFAAAFLVTSLLTSRGISQTVRAVPVAATAPRIASLVALTAGLHHLAMSLFVAGTHERYAGCAFPLLFVALAHLAPKKLPALCACASVYGLHVLSTVEWSAFAYAFPLRAPQLAACALTTAFALALRPLVRAAARQELPSPAP